MKNYLNIFFIAVIAVLLFLLLRSCEGQKDFQKLIAAQQDTLRISRNAQGQQQATISLLQTSVKDFKQLNAGKDSTLKRLQQLVDRHTLAATIHNTLTGNVFTAPTSIQKVDTVKSNDTISLQPTYVTRYENRWENFNITASPDSFKVDYKLYNEFDHQVRYNKVKWYKARVPEITVTNLNPHTETKDLKSFSLSSGLSNKVVFFGGITIGISVSILTLLILKN